MPDQSEISLCIMGETRDVYVATKALSDEKGCFNPFKVFAMEEVIYQIPSFINPNKGETISEYKNRMYGEYLSLQARQNYANQFRLHRGPAMNPSDFPGLKLIDKEICFFTKPCGVPIQEFSTISKVFPKVAFAMSFDSSWNTHHGSVYISRGDVWYSNYRMQYKDLNGFDLWLDKNFDFRYLTKFETPGMLVPVKKLQGIDRTFKRADPEDLKHIYPYFPHPDFDSDRDTKDEFIPDDYIPVLYTPSEKEIRNNWDQRVSEYLQQERKQFLNQ